MVVKKKNVPKGKWGYSSNYSSKKYPDVPMVAVGKGKTWYFRSKKEAAKIMGLTVPQITKEMKSNGKNASNLRWYTRKFYDEKIAPRERDKGKGAGKNSNFTKPVKSTKPDKFGYIVDERGIKRDKKGNKVPDIDPVKDKDDILKSLKALDNMYKKSERAIKNKERKTK